MPPSSRARGCLPVALVLLVVLGLLTALGVAGFRWLRERNLAGPVPGQQRCVVTADGRSVVLDLDQARYTSIIVGLSVRRGLPARAASIAMATVYQETGIRNLDYGDRDSVGLFQQRPSQGWGTEEQLQDPYYATGRFYGSLVRVRGWESGDINDVAQRVQRSGYPEAYRDHEADARVLASALTGYSPAALTCLERGEQAGDARGLVAGLQRTYGSVTTRTEPAADPGATAAPSATPAGGTVVTVRAGSSRLAWAYGHYAVANARDLGITAVTVGDREWRTDAFTLPSWQPAAAPAGGREVRVSLR